MAARNCSATSLCKCFTICFDILNDKHVFLKSFSRSFKKSSEDAEQVDKGYSYRAIRLPMTTPVGA
jgi:hypothetical protein